MAFSAAAKSAFEKIKQGPVAVYFDFNTADEVEVFVDGGISPEFERGQENAEVDLLNVYDSFSTGDGATFELALSEQSLDAMKVLFGDQADANAASDYQPFGHAAGVSGRTNAKEVTIMPWQDRRDSTVKIVFWKCIPEGNLANTFNKTESWKNTQTFRALPDLDKVNGELIGRFYAPDR